MFGFPKNKTKAVGPFTLEWTTAHGTCSLTIAADGDAASLNFFIVQRLHPLRTRGGAVMDRAKLRAYLADVIKHL